MNITFSDVLATLALGGCAYLIFENKKLKEKVEDAVDEIAKGIDVNVDNKIISEAVNRAVDREAKAQVRNACYDAVAEVRGSLSQEVKKAVNTERDSLKEQTKNEIAKKVSEIDISKARKEVIEEAKEKVAEKFEDDLEIISDSYKDMFDKVSNIYDSISDTVLKTKNAQVPDDGFVIKLV